MIYRDDAGRLRYPAVVHTADGRQLRLDLSLPTSFIDVPRLLDGGFSSVRYGRTRKNDRDGRRIYKP